MICIVLLLATSGKEWTCVLLFHLLNVNSSFRAFVIRHPHSSTACCYRSSTSCTCTVTWSTTGLTCWSTACWYMSQDEGVRTGYGARLRVDEVVPWWTRAAGERCQHAGVAADGTTTTMPNERRSVTSSITGTVTVLLRYPTYSLNHAISASLSSRPHPNGSLGLACAEATHVRLTRTASASSRSIPAGSAVQSRRAPG